MHTSFSHFIPCPLSLHPLVIIRPIVGAPVVHEQLLSLLHVSREHHHHRPFSAVLLRPHAHVVAPSRRRLVDARQRGVHAEEPSEEAGAQNGIGEGDVGGAAVENFVHVAAAVGRVEDVLVVLEPPYVFLAPRGVLQLGRHEALHVPLHPRIRPQHGPRLHVRVGEQPRPRPRHSRRGHGQPRGIHQQQPLRPVAPEDDRDPHHDGDDHGVDARDFVGGSEKFGEVGEGGGGERGLGEGGHVDG
mmetsp:Transcript_26/g.56  ORF Transcript_26/g.56 Transcript_26/m.56 type:complete len:244 (+) Transcript_26:378-1109(+)